MTAIGIDAVGSGVWMPVSMIFFLATTDLSLVQVGLALSLASLLSLPAAILVGQQVDRLGSKTVLQAGNALQAASFLLYPFVDQVWSVALVVSASVIGRTAFWGSYSPMVTLISPPGEREKWFGFLGALRNAGFAIGGVVAGVALTIDATTLYYAVALLNAASYVLSFGCSPASPSTRQPSGLAHADPAEVVGGWGTVLRDRRLPVAGRQQLRLRDDVGRAQRGDPRVRRGDARPARLGVGGGVRDQHADDRRRSGRGRPADDRRGARPDRRARRGAHRRVVPRAVGRGTRSGWSPRRPWCWWRRSSTRWASWWPDRCSPRWPRSRRRRRLRGRYLATYQLSWNVATGVAPLLYAWLLDLGSAPAWLGLTAIALLGALATLPMRRRLAHAGRVVTNRAEPLPA